MSYAGLSVRSPARGPVYDSVVGKWGAVPAVSAQDAEFGALTLASAGGWQPVDDNGTHVSLASVDDQTGATRTWSISSGYLIANGTPDVDDTIDLTLTTITGKQFTATVVSSGNDAQGDSLATIAHATTEAQFKTAAALGNLTVKMRPLTYPEWTTCDVTASNVTLKAQTGATFLAMRFSSANTFTIDGLNFENDNPTALSPATAGTNVIYFGHASSNMTIRNCTFDCYSGDWSTTLGGIAIRFGTGTIENNTIINVRQGIGVRQCATTPTISGNHIEKFHEDAIRVDNTGATITDNVFTRAWGWTGRRLTGVTVDSGTINVGDELWSADSSLLSSNGGEIVAIDSGAGTVDIRCNSVQLALTAATLVGPTGTISFTGNSTAYEGLHRDCIQAFAFGATSDLPLTIARNLYYRSDPFEPGVIIQELHSQGIYISTEIVDPYKWTFAIEHNIICEASGHALTASKARSGYVRYNTVIDISDEIRTETGTTPFLRREDVAGVTFNNNVAPLYTTVGSDLGTFTDNLTIGIDDYATEFPDYPATPPFNLLTYFTPDAGGTVEAGTAGALDSTGTYRPALVNVLPQPTNIDDAAWTKAGTTTSVSNVVSDVDTSLALAHDQVAANSGSTYRLEAFVLKDADTSRYPAIGLFATSGDALGTASNTGIYVINTSAGTLTAYTSNVGSPSASIEDAGTHWKITIDMTINTSWVQCRIYPAFNNNGTGGVAGAATGSVTIQGVYIYNIS